jgi:hypothetical protein
MARFRNVAELHEVMDKLFSLMARDPEVGPRLRSAQAPHRISFTDYGTSVTVRPADDKKAARGQLLEWKWDEKGWPVVVSLSMSSEVANRFFQGRENIPLAVAKGAIVVGDGELPRSLELVPLLKPIFPKYKQLLANDKYEHLKA